MGRYDEPHFEVEGEDVVSIWAASRPFADIPDDYFEPNDEGEDDDPYNRFSADFGFGYYDHDFVEHNVTQDGLPAPIANLLAPVSYSRSFQDAAAVQAESLGVGRTALVFLLYNFRYDPAVTRVRESEYLRFVGVFSYDRTAKSHTTS